MGSHIETRDSDLQTELNLNAPDCFKVSRPSTKSARHLAETAREAGTKYIPGLRVSRVRQLRWLYRLSIYSITPQRHMGDGWVDC